MDALGPSSSQAGLQQQYVRPPTPETGLHEAGVDNPDAFDDPPQYRANGCSAAHRDLRSIASNPRDACRSTGEPVDRGVGAMAEFGGDQQADPFEWSLAQRQDVGRRRIAPRTRP